MLQKYKKTTKKYFNSFQIYFTFIDFQKCLINCCCQRKAIKIADFISFLSNLAPFVIEIQSIIYLTYAELCVRILFSLLLLLRNHIKRGRRLLEFPREKKAKQTIATTTIAATNKPQTAKKFARRQTRRARVQKTKRVKVKDNKKKQQKKVNKNKTS